jgi:hypothetical protein
MYHFENLATDTRINQLTNKRINKGCREFTEKEAKSSVYPWQPCYVNGDTFIKLGHYRKFKYQRRFLVKMFMIHN